VMQTLDTLGAGFQLASHDLDIRGAGNLLGDEQSGHIREVGVELYQLRGRIGRSKLRAYAYLTLPEKKRLAPTAQRRLDVMQTLDTLGAGF